MTKRRIAVVAAIVSCLALLAVGTLAYFTAEETAFNVITTGKLAMELHEETANGDPFPADGIHGVMPGDSVDKIVYIENTGNVDFYARISLSEAIQAAQGVSEELSLKYVSLDINTADWTEKDGYYYYNRALKPGEKTEPLFTKVSFDAAMGNSYMECTVTIDVAAQTVQSKNNGDGPLTASGWSAE